MYLYFNGNFVDEATPIICGIDRGLLYGEGLFETIRVYDGNPILFDLHWQRLTQGAQFLQISLPIEKQTIKKHIKELLALNKLSAANAGLRISLTSGPVEATPLPTHQTKATFKSTLFIRAFTLPPQPSAMSLTTAKYRKNEFSPLALIKSLNYLDNILARKQAYHLGTDDALLLNTNGAVVETTIANIFIVKDKTSIVTPPLSDGPLPGIARRIIIGICQDLGINITQRTVKPEELLTAEELFISNALKHAVPVRSLDQQLIGKGDYFPVTEQIKSAYTKFLRTPQIF